MAIQAGVLRDTSVSFLDLNGLVEVACRECERVEEAVVRFGQPLATEVVGKVAVITGRNPMMAGLGPGIVMCLHDMAVRT
jgi:hypothetical protein